MLTRLLHATWGILATLAGVAAAHLVAALTVPAASPVLVVGSTVIDLTPTPLKTFAIEQFGNADKPILIGSVMVGVLVLAGIAGIIAARRLTAGLLMLLALTVLVGVLAMLRPAAGPLDLLPAVTAAIVGVASLWWLHRLESSGSEDGATGPTRRGVLIAAGVLAVAAAAFGTAGRFISSYRLKATDIDLPTAAKSVKPLPAGLEDKIKGISSFVTPTKDFYRVDTRLTLPIVDADSWTLTIDGDVDEEVTLTLADLYELEVIERDITLTCVSNDVGGPYVGAARWLGVRLTDVLDLAGIDNTKADQIVSTDVEGMTIGTPFSVATDGRDAMIVFGMNGEALPREHGFPVRMVVPGLYGFVSACKWITKITLTTYDEQEVYWTERDWATDAPIKISSRIDTPKALSSTDAGKTFIGGVAWAQGVGIEGVEVSIDGGAWKPAEMGPDAGDDYWRQWFVEWDAKPGQHFLSCRATNKDGDLQSDVRMKTFPEGSSGIQNISVTVA
ncbi:molybdopterin-dependent oxidoreductase [Nocardioides sp.]|uniref:molybdopterin-dependent oxidoreductase n=1 Tax=Nocardioides sp. TaxID=35761 RepID=UPI002D1BC155|nr:molybdopterin-dependent oxidoreductase [Nocardioides sp.]HXH79088.1 molybdopterin-dependent oxidoreductase [Nocardioides sp.]